MAVKTNNSSLFEMIRNSIFRMEWLEAQEKITDSHFWIFKEYPQKSQIWKSETSPNPGTWLGIPWLGVVSLCQIWDFYGYSLNTQKYSKNWNPLFFPVKRIKGYGKMKFRREKYYTESR